MIRIALLSMAHLHAEGYARQVRNSTDAQIVCVWDDVKARGEKYAKEYGATFDNDLARVLSRKDVDAVIVNSETRKHRDLFIAAAHAKKHIFTEKAFTLTGADADEVAKEIQASGVKFMISLPERSTREAVLLKKLVSEGTLGSITTARFRMAHSAALDKWFNGDSAWFAESKSAGGALFDLGCHTVDIMRWLLGEPVSVLCKNISSSGTGDIDDNAVVILQFPNKALGIIEAGYTQRCGPNFWEVYGTEGCALRGGPDAPVVYMTTKNGENPPKWMRTKMPAPRPSAIQQWFNAILRNEPADYGLDDARRLSRIIAAAYQSAREGREIKLD